MEDLKEIYDNFIRDLSNISIKKKNKNVVSNISNLISFVNTCNQPDCVKSLQESTVKNFINSVDDVYSSIVKKKKKNISDFESFGYFIKIIKTQKEFNEIFNFYNSSSLNVDFSELGGYLQENDVSNFKEFYNYFVLLYIESCHYLYPSLRSDEDANDSVLPEKTRHNYNLLIDSYNEESFLTSDKFGENFRTLLLLLNEQVNKSTTLHEKLLKILNNDQFTVLMEDMILLYYDDNTELMKINDELQNLKKEDIISYCTIYKEKIKSINILDLITNFNLQKVMGIVNDIIPGVSDLNISEDIMKQAFNSFMV